MTGRFRVIFVLILMVTMGEHSLQAADHPNFSGFWTLDLKAPKATSIDALLETATHIRRDTQWCCGSVECVRF